MFTIQPTLNAHIRQCPHDPTNFLILYNFVVKKNKKPEPKNAVNMLCRGFSCGNTFPLEIKNADNIRIDPKTPFASQELHSLVAKQ